MVSPYVIRSYKRWVYYSVWLTTIGYIMFYCPGRVRESPKQPQTIKRPDTVQTSEKVRTTGSPVVLLWTSYYGSLNWDFDVLGSTPFNHELCQTRCYATTDRRYLSQADVILFNYVDADLNDWPQNVSSSQTLILMIQEPPSEVGVNIYKFHNRVQLVMSYRRDSDIYAPYRVLKPVVQSMPDDIPRVPLSDRNRTVVWISDDCETESQREKYVKELSKHISVDVYGKCGTLACPKDPEDCMAIFEMNYKFYLAFESSICKDYVTDHMFQTLRFDIVPVVFGGYNYLTETMNGCASVIDSMQFPNPKALAEQLKFVAESEERFNQFFKDKLRYRVLDTNGAITGGLCKLCDWLQYRKTSDVIQYRSNLATWWNVGTCHNEYIPEQERTW